MVEVAQALDDGPLRRLDLASLGLLFSDREGVAAYEAQAVQVTIDVLVPTAFLCHLSFEGH